MAVVPAGMHDPFDLGGERKSGPLGDRERIDVRPQRDDGAGSGSRDVRNDAVPSNAGAVPDAEIGQLTTDASRRPLLLARQFGMPVQLPPEGDDSFDESGREIVGCHTSTLPLGDSRRSHCGGSVERKERSLMEYRRLGSTGWQVSAVGFGGWALGADWGTVTEGDAMAALHAAVDGGVNFIDTADVYGDGRSERLVARLLHERRDVQIHVATKAGRRLDPHEAAGYTAQNLEAFVERSLSNLSIDALPLLQLHCPPPEVYDDPDVFAALDALRAAGMIRHYGVSVETIDEAMRALEHPGVETVQIIFNVFRQRPGEEFFAAAASRDVGVIVRVPLASGLLSGRMTSASTFPPDDHRNYNRDGAAFDVGETFAGVPFDVGLEAADAIRPLVPDGWTMAQLALRWILMWDEVSTTIPGAKNEEQAAGNAAAADLPPLDDATMARLEQLYGERVAAYVHDRW